MNLVYGQENKFGLLPLHKMIKSIDLKNILDLKKSFIRFTVDPKLNKEAIKFAVSILFKYECQIKKVAVMRRAKEIKIRGRKFITLNSKDKIAVVYFKVMPDLDKFLNNNYTNFQAKAEVSTSKKK